jgi:hypothetical protein
MKNFSAIVMMILASVAIASAQEVNVILLDSVSSMEQILKNIEEKYSKQVDYVEPASRPEFFAKNNCIIASTKDSSLTCTRVINGIRYIGIFSRDLIKLLGHKMNCSPAENEIVMFYQMFENRLYDFDIEERPERYVSVCIAPNLRKAIEKKKFDVIDIIKAYEHEFFNISDFSGLSLYMEVQYHLDSEAPKRKR